MDHEDNKDTLGLKKKQRVNCKCGSIVNISHIARHYQSKKHLNYLKSLDSESESDTESMKEWKEAESIQGYGDIN